MPRITPSKVDWDILGTTYSAAWTASSSTATRTKLTDSIVLPPGTYIIVLITPSISTSNGWVGFMKFDKWLGNINGPEWMVLIETLTETTELYAQSGTGSTMTFDSLSRAGLKAMRVK